MAYYKIYCDALCQYWRYAMIYCFCDFLSNRTSHHNKKWLETEFWLFHNIIYCYSLPG